MKTVHIYGGASSDTPPPEQLPGEEKWGINHLWSRAAFRPRYEGWTRWCDLHTDEHIKSRKHSTYNWLCQQTRPIVRFWPDPNMNTQLYPHAEVRAMFGGTRFFCSSFDWMMALALYESFQRIHLYGWKMSHPVYAHQVKSGQFWIRKALNAGVDLQNHSPSSLFIVKHDLVEPNLSRCLMYGLETTDRSKLYSHRWAT